jgi:hypothetical protein
MTPNTPKGFDLSYYQSWDHIFHRSEYAEQELIRNYGYPTTPQAQAIYDRVVAKSQEKVPFDEWVSNAPCTIL